MLALCAVEPNGSRGIGNLICEGPVGYVLGVHSRDETRPEAVIHRSTWRVEGGLRNGVVLGPEMEGDCVTLCSGDAVGLEDQLAGLGSNGNLVVDGKSRANKGSSSEKSSEMHYNWLWR